MKIKDFLSPSEGFQTSVNIAFDFGSDDKVKGLIPTDTVCRYVEALLKDVISPSTQRAKLLVGPYSRAIRKGKIVYNPRRPGGDVEERRLRLLLFV